MDVVVVGGGVVGLACAHALSERGIRVVVLERATVGAGASRGNTGWVVPSLSMPLASPGMLTSGLRAALNPRGALVIRPGLDASWVRWLWQFRRSCTLESFRHGVAALLELNRYTFEQLDAYRAQGIEFESHSTGILVVARHQRGIKWFATLYDELGRAGYGGTLEELDGPQARELEPALSDEVACGLLSRADRHVQPESLVRGLSAHVKRNGVEIREGAGVASIARASGRWQLRTDGNEVQTVDADRVVIAAGAASTALSASLGLRLPMVGAKGYSLDVVGEGRAPRIALYLSEAKIGLSPFDGGVRLAGVFELPGRSLRIDARRVQQLEEDTRRYIAGWRPKPAEAEGRGWAGLRPATPDGLPLLGPVPGLPGVIVATGHGMLGVTLAPATGAVVADMIATDTAPAWLDPFRPGRRL